MPPIGALIGVVISGLTSAITAITGVLGGLVSFSGLGAFLLSPIGSLIIGIGLQLISTLFVRRPQTPSIEAGRVNVRVAEPERWINAGIGRQGGGVVFAEFDAAGNFWYIIIHSDSRHNGITKRYLDDVEISIDGNNDVTTNDFCLKQDYSAYKGSGTKRIYFTIWTRTYTLANPTPPAVTELQAAFPGSNGWTADHKLVGTTYSVIRVKPVPVEHRYKVYRWRGPVGIGEPAFSIVANWSDPYDPRTGTYGPTKNSVLIWAWFRMHRYGRNKSFNSINWNRIAEQANICDLNVVGIAGTQKMYECGTAIPESKERATAEQEILMSCDGQIVFDDDGKSWVRVGQFYEPELTLYRNRDIFGVESVEAQNGESETQGVIVRYIDPDAKYITQPSAPWVNPLYYVEGETPKYLVLDILSCQNHNQAMRLAKAYGLKSQSSYKLLPTCGLRGLKAQKERIIDFQYDNTFAGNHEIVTPVELDETGIFTGFGIVPVDENRWKLLPGEEKSKPVIAIPDQSGDPVLPTGVTISYDGVKFNIAFNPLPREDHRYRFQYKLATESDDKYLDCITKMSENIATSGGVVQLKNYNIRYRTETSSGVVTDWISPVVTIYTSLLTVSGTPITTGKVGVAYAGFTVSASGGEAPYLFLDMYSKLPPGIVINSSTGVVSGTPTTAGTYSGIIIRVQDINGAFNYLTTFTITVAP